MNIEELIGAVEEKTKILEEALGNLNHRDFSDEDYDFYRFRYEGEIEILHWIKTQLEEVLKP